jgi:predicted N-acetyltransferase YhbS
MQVLTSLSVAPKYQRKSVGTLLVKHCMKLSDAEHLPIFLNSFPGAHNLYLRLAFKDLEHFDIDLNEWGTKYRGYGVYRRVK